nr:hypothetical protein [Tanacetum cinerariifolium]
GQDGILEQMDLLPWDLICPRWSVTTATGKDTFQGSVGLLRILEGMSFQVEEEPSNFALMAFTSSSSSFGNEFAPTPIYDRYQSGDRYHVVPPPYTGTFMPPKPDLVFHNAPNDVETVHTAFNVELSPTKPDNDLSLTHRTSAPIIEDWVSDSEDESETKIPQNVPSFVQPSKQVKSPRPSVQHVKTSIPTANHKTAIPKPTSNGKHRNRKACFHYARMSLPNPQRHVVPTVVITKSKLVHINAVRPVTAAVPKPHVARPRLAKPIVTKPHLPPRRHINRSPSPKAKLNGGYFAFGGNPKGG